MVNTSNFHYYLIRMPSGRNRVHRIISWVLALFSVTTIVSGYLLSRGLVVDIYLMSLFHRLSEVFFIGLLIIHVIVTMRYYAINWHDMKERFLEHRMHSIHILRLVQRVSSWLIVVATLLVILSGLNGTEWFAATFGERIPFSLHRLYDLFLASMVIIHVAIGLKFWTIRRRLKGSLVNGGILLLAISLLALTSSVNLPEPRLTPRLPTQAEVKIAGTDYSFNPLEVTTVRPDVFRPGYFSLFDVLVHLDTIGKVELEYHFNASLNTHIIDTLNGTENWWYLAFYTGGWLERSSFRMDLYPYREETTLWFLQEDALWLESVYAAFADEVERKEQNNGSVIIPQIVIYAPGDRLEFNNITVSPYNLRNDTFQNDIITALDIIMSLGEQGLITYELEWYESIGRASIVRSYWVEAINGHFASGTCGFVYESGSHDFEGFIGNHIHLPSDSRVLTSPEYNKWFWICI